MTNAALTTCGATEGRCVCILAPHDAGPHVCECEGSWEVIDGEVVTRAIPRLDMATGEQVPWWDPDPAVAAAGYEAVEVDRLLAAGMDPLMASIVAKGPIRAKRGGISFLTPPKVEQ